MNCKSRGNAFLITLVSVVLLGALTFVVMRQMNGTAVQSVSGDRAEIYANQLINYGIEAQSVVDQMTQLHVPYIDLTDPGSGSFNTGDNNVKLFHPAGGGLRYLPKPDPVMTKNGLWILTATNIDWTPTTAADIVFILRKPIDAVCQAINKRMTGSTTIPAFAGSTPTSALCPSCVGYPMMCFLNTSNGTNSFYIIVQAN